MATTPIEHATVALHPARICERVRHAAHTWLVTSRTIPLAVAAITFLVFSPALLNGFVEWDDYRNLFENGGFRGLGWKQIHWMFTSTLMGHYIPVTWLSFAVDYTLWGMNPLGYHLTSGLLHSVNAALFYLVALRLMARGSSLSGWPLRVGGVMAALLFALHPLRAESVAWATERRDVLSGLFALVSVLLYLRAADIEGVARRRLRAGSLACYALALLSKSIVMTLPLVLVLLDLYPLGRLPSRWTMWRDPSARAVLREKLPYAALGFAGAITSYWAVASNHILTGFDTYDWGARIGMAGYSLRFYVEKTFVPLGLSPLHELPATVNLLEPRFLLSVLAVVAISVTVLALRRRWPAGLAVWVYYGLVLGPVTGIVHSGHQLTHDRYSYLSCLGVAILVGTAAGSLTRAAATGTVRPWVARGAAAAGIAWILALGTLTWYQVQIWKDTETLWRYAAESDPGCSICHINIGYFYYRRHLYGLAKDECLLALQLRPDRAWAHGNLGVVLQALGDTEGALRELDLALARHPDEPSVLTNMGVVLIGQQRYADAMPYLERATRIDPSFVPGLVNQGIALTEMGRPDAGLPHLLRARELKPDEPLVHVRLARAYLAIGRIDEARKTYDTLVKLDLPSARGLEPALASAR